MKTEEKESYQVSVTIKSIVGDVDRAKSVEVFGLLSEPMPAEALHEDNSRGFLLTSIKAAFVIERLNATLGLLGFGWRYAHSDAKIETASGHEEVTLRVALQWRVCEQAEGEGFCGPVYWRDRRSPNRAEREWAFAKGPQVWSEPIFAHGGANAKRKGSLPYKDACQSAVTNGITKAASRLGVGLEVFKGEQEPPYSDEPQQTGARRARAARGKSKSTTVPAPKKKPGKDTNFATLTAMQKAAVAEVDKLAAVEGQADARTVQALAHRMSALGLKMQTARLIHLLLGKGELSQQRIMGINNFLLSAKLSAENIDTLNATAWEGFPGADSED